MTDTQSQPANRYDAALADKIETRWQQWWDQHQVYKQPNPGEPGFDPSRPKFYCLDMFPYPSGAGLHVGHPEGYTASDIICRYKRMRGFNVLHPMGWDAFGLPAEQYAIQTGVHPEVTTRTAIDNFRRQLKRFGFSYDWSREFGTIDEDYYHWTQWIFLKLYNAWFDPEAGNGRGRARHIDELVEEFYTGKRRVRLNPNAAEYTGAGDLPDGTDAGEWSSLDSETKHAIIDSYRLAYLSQQTVNWCPKLGTALANEEVIDGKSERGGYPVFRKPLRQWMFRITAYADRLLDDLANLDWPESTKTQQAEWIGRSEGAEIDFPLLDLRGEKSGESLRVFTTRPDTIFGATYMVVAPEHPIVELTMELPHPETDENALRSYVQWARNRSDIERQENKEKTGVFTGVYVINPATRKKIPVWTSDYVLMGYGTGAIMAVPAQDTRDWEFATKFNLPIVRTVQPPQDWPDDQPFTGDGPAINSDFLNGLSVAEAKQKIIAWLQQHHIGARRVNYRLRDWLFSRQRYWGEPFPIVFDPRGQHHPVAEDKLPVRLPRLTDYQPAESDEPTPLLGKATDWVHTTAAEAGVADLPPDTPVRRETNTMPGWAGSCWYYLRFCDPKNSNRFASREAERYWMVTPELSVEPEEVHDSGTFQPHTQRVGGVDLYIGGAEHAVLHLLYARFWHKVLFDLGEVSTPEPFHKLFHQGLITSHAFQRADRSLVAIDEVENRGTDDKPAYFEIKTNQPVTQIVAKMSKSLKNVVNPDDVIASYGADTFRLYEMYMGPLEASKPWNTRDIVGLHRLLQKIWRLCINEDGSLRLTETHSPDTEKRLHRLVAKVGSDIERLSFNTAIAAIFEFVNDTDIMTRVQTDWFVRVIAPFTPHIGEELWHRLGHHDKGSVAFAPWPVHDEKLLVDDEIEIPVQILGKVRSKIIVPAKADPKALEAAALADPRIAELIEGKSVRKVIVVPGKMVNIVAN
ncbi:MAG: leucine--tRNA ligase [Planctomycetota bacterium]|nr:MAG: leucine--tRNA ligase [Planctomycetota bacterium]